MSLILRIAGKLGLERYTDPMAYAIKHGMKVGSGVTLASRQGSSFGTEPFLIELGDYVRLSGRVTFITHDGGTYAFRDLDKYKGVQKFGRITVGEHSFIGYGVIIMPGVNIGKRCVVGAGAIVTRDVPDETVVAGIPAKRICSTWEYADKCMNESNRKGYKTDDVYTDRRQYITEHETKNDSGKNNE